MSQVLCYSRSSDIDFTDGSELATVVARLASSLSAGFKRVDAASRSFRIVALWIEVYEVLIRQQCRFTLTSCCSRLPFLKEEHWVGINNTLPDPTRANCCSCALSQRGVWIRV